MTAMSEEQIRRLLEAPGNLEVAIEVDRHWHAVRADVVRRFADRLSEQIKKHLRENLSHLGELRCKSEITGGNERYQAIRVFRGGDAWLVDENRVEIRLEAQHSGLQGWILGVATGRTNFRRTLDDPNPFETALKKKKSPGWPWYEWVDKPWVRWLDILPTLVSELEEDGDATRYFVKRAAAICEVAVPIIDDRVGRYVAAGASQRAEIAQSQSE